MIVGTKVAHWMWSTWNSARSCSSGLNVCMSIFAMADVISQPLLERSLDDSSTGRIMGDACRVDAKGWCQGRFAVEVEAAAREASELKLRLTSRRLRNWSLGWKQRRPSQPIPATKELSTAPPTAELPWLYYHQDTASAAQRQQAPWPPATDPTPMVYESCEFWKLWILETVWRS